MVGWLVSTVKNEEKMRLGWGWWGSIKFANIVDDVVAMLLGRKRRFKAFIRSEHILLDEK